ncbi:hypothetical protein HN789_06405 [archaeon]|jgi:hypothetical protein|nr:hypothetical protein [archaeon]MBT4022805.1 hypothetical protein [archaeon]MBT4273001.1 hypothetical protein [archaeon]MBT4460908.1 hypothetical protein [archaeon]MBT4858124.1 hypothetical protein [archaeon]
MAKSSFAPLNGTFMGVSIVGLLISIYYVIYPTINISSFFSAFFIILFIMSALSKGKSSLGYMMVSILGIIASIIFYYYINSDKLSGELFISPQTWGLTFAIFFAYMFFNSMVSMTVANPDDFVEIEGDFKPKKNK